ncbi:MAG TPA: protein-glutamate O-methyltransferase CheR [Methylomirabilota bacterium]|nr:protein-glutamate O-methyltransferase CheR [Methylomirabilota bacterium]
MIGAASMPGELEPSDLARLAALVTERAGLAFGEARWPFLRNRAREAMLRRGFISVRRWLEELETSAERRGSLYCDLEEALQVHETSFFRYAEHHRILREVVLPAMVRTGGARVRICSVGCATGEEPYSIAMTVRETLARPTCPVEVLGLDASRPALTAAVSGRYPASRVASIPPAYREKYLVPDPDGFAVVPGLRQMVRFRHHDIRRGFYIGKFHVIVCCNVLLYFTPAVKQEILTRLAASLWEGGFLFLGHADGITPPASLFEVLPAGFVYQRIGRSVELPTLSVAATTAASTRHD